MEIARRTYMVIILLVCCGILLSCTTLRQKGEPDDRGMARAGDSFKKALCAVSDLRFEMRGGKERITIMSVPLPAYKIVRDGQHVFALYLEDARITDGVKSSYTAVPLTNIGQVNLSEEISEGKPVVKVVVRVKKIVPYRVTGAAETGIIIDFDVSSLAYRKNLNVAGESSGQYIPPAAVDEAFIKAELEKLKKAEDSPAAYRGGIITLDVQDADIHSIFRLIAEVSGMSIVASPAIKGKVTLNMKEVPWDQALATILEITGLGQKQTGTVITVLPLEELKKAEEEEQQKAVAEGKLRQIAIEAKIVEVSTEFGRQLGVRWGYGYKDAWRGRDYGLLFGNSASVTGSTEVATLSDGIGLTGSNMAVNFPSGAAAATPALGLVIGSGKFILDAKLEALEATGEGKIISSPKVTTLDNVEATIKQGEEVPYSVKDKEGNPTIEFKDAALLLTVKPQITPDEKISMEVKATNDYADWGRANAQKENPPINTSSVESTIVVSNGDTIVVGGIYKTTEAETMEGIPWLCDIPVLGWLFKSKAFTKEKRELMIFVTPRIIEASAN